MSVDVLQEKIRKLKCPIVLDLSVEPEHIPAALLESGDEKAMTVYCKALMSGLKGVVPSVRFSFDQFALMGASGLETLRKLLREAHSLGYYVLLDGPAVNTPWAAKRAATMLEEESDLYCDGLMISSYIGSDVLKPFLQKCRAGKSLFVIVRSPNKSAAELQDLMTGSRLVHAAAADIVNRHGECILGKCGYSQIAAVTSATNAGAVFGLRSKYNRLFLLVDGLDYPGGNGKNASYGFDRFGHGCAVSVGPAITAAWREKETDGTDYVQQAQKAAERIRNNLNRYISIL
jgi:orotidine-5'-phosphate decarboxylase